MENKKLNRFIPNSPIVEWTTKSMLEMTETALEALEKEMANTHRNSKLSIEEYQKIVCEQVEIEFQLGSIRLVLSSENAYDMERYVTYRIETATCVFFIRNYCSVAFSYFIQQYLYYVLQYADAHVIIVDD